MKLAKLARLAVPFGGGTSPTPPPPAAFRTRIGPAPDAPIRRKSSTIDPSRSVVKGK